MPRTTTPADQAFPSPAAGRRYIVPMFPYPSGTLHVGHARNYAIADAIARIERMKGHEVLFPIGWDAFGLPAENAAIEHGVAPSSWTRSNIATMKRSLHRMGFSFDWDREIATCDPQTYRFSQLFFVQMLKAGFIYRSETVVAWDPVERTVLAREQVIDGRGWRSGAVVEERIVPSWTARVTAFADELIDGLDSLDWPETAKAIGRSWIGRQEDGTFRLHDWNLSRQRYWGCPVPIVECGTCGLVPVPEAQLPVVLPEDVRLEQPGHPLEESSWRDCACPSCGQPAQRSVETLDTFFDSSWYFLRYPSVGEAGSGSKPMVPAGRPWMPVDHYVGGIEHASMHLIYARFFCKALRSLGYDVPGEPFTKLTAQGLVRAQVWLESTELGDQAIAPSEVEQRDGQWVVRSSGRPVRPGPVEKMSKSKKNGETIDALMDRGHSADAIRFALFFAGPFAQAIDWSDKALGDAEKALRRLVAACTVAGRTEAGEQGEDPMVQQATRDFIRRMHTEMERGEGLNVTIGAGLGALRVFEKALREGRGGTGVREGLLALCAGFFPIVPATARDAAQRIVPGWEANAVGLPRPLAPTSTPRRTPAADLPGASSDAPPEGITAGIAADGASSHTLVVQVNGRFVQACEAPGFGTQEEAVDWAFSHCEALERRVTREGVGAVHWKPGRVLNLVSRPPVPSPVSWAPAPRPRPRRP